MKKDFFIIQLLFFVQIISFIFTQKLNVINVGKPNFANVNVFSSGNSTLMGTSAFPFSNEKIIYDISGNILPNIYHEKSLSIPRNITYYSSTNFTYQNFSEQSFCYDIFWIAITRENMVEIQNLQTNMPFLNFNIKETYGFDNIIEFGSVVPVVNYDDQKVEYFVLPFIIENKNNRNISYYFNFFQIIPFYNLDSPFYIMPINYNYTCAKGKVISCFTTLKSLKLVCLFRNEKYYLALKVFNDLFENEKELNIELTTNEKNNENMFFKAISFLDDASIIAYYTNYDDNYMRICFKKFEYGDNGNITINNYDIHNIEMIPAGDYSKHYKLNDLVALENNDIYIASSSLDREKLYLNIFRINNSVIFKRSVTINLFQDYKFKFYNDLKLVSYLESAALGFSHCNKQICEENSFHTSSLVILNDFNSDYQFDFIKQLYDTNSNLNDSLQVDFNIYKNNILGLKFNHITFVNIPFGVKIIIPSNKSEVKNNTRFGFSTFNITISDYNTGNLNLKYYLNLDDSDIFSRRNLRNLAMETNNKLVSFNIDLSKELSTDCEGRCNLCELDDPSICITCKYQYYTIGDKKFCLDEDGQMNDTDVSDVYTSIKDNIGDQDSKVYKQDGYTIQLSTVEEQLNNTSKDISIIDLGECELELRKNEGLEDDEQFIMIKMDLRNTSVNATYVQYEIINPHTMQPVDISVCKDLPITIYTPVSISDSKLSLISNLEESGYNVFDIRDSFYNDICSRYTAENGADMVLSSRKELIYDQNKDMYLCQDGCSFVNFDSKNVKAKCDCDVQLGNTKTDITQLKFDKTEFIDSFYTTLFNSNFRVLKCVKLLFSSKGLATNYGSYIMSLLLGCFIAFTVLHLLTGQKYLNDIINNILQSKGVEVDNVNEKAKEKEKKKDKEKKTENDKDKENEKKEEKENKKDDEKEQDNKKEENNEKNQENQENKEKNKKGGRRKSLNKNSSKKRKSAAQNINVDEVQVPPKKEGHKKRKSRHSISKDKNENNPNIAINTKMDLIDGKNNNKGKEETKEKKKHKHHHHHHHHETDEKILLENAKGLNDEEMNSLYYEEALVIDKRSYFQYYLSLIRKKQLLIFTFYPNNDYNFTALKILLFIVSFSLYFTINGFFFNDDTMNKIYEDNGSYNILTTLPQIFYSSVVSAVINMILKKLSLTESQILEIKKEKDKKKAQDKAKKTKYSLSIKLIIFLVLSIILMLFFWYFISCFCAVYINTQKQLIGDTFLSFGLSMLYPFGLNLLPGLFRIPALRAPKKDKKYIYKISRYIAFI